MSGELPEAYSNRSRSEDENSPLWKRWGYIVDNGWKNALLGASGTALINSEQRGWDYEVVRTSNVQDGAEIEQLSREMLEDDAQRTVALDACWRHASDLLTTHWHAVKTLAGELLALQWLTGAEAHTIIGEALGEEQGDWRLDVLQADPINQRRTAYAAERKQLVVDFLKGVITE
jgi:hypothetical protein